MLLPQLPSCRSHSQGIPVKLPYWQAHLGGAHCHSLLAPLRLSRRGRRRPRPTTAEAPAWNPQNVPNPQVLPSKDFSAEEAVRVQLEALKNNNKPWSNHGIQLMYEFGEGIGGLDPCYYFGFRKDLYHFDHFLGQFQNQLGELLDCSSYSIEDVKEHLGADEECGPEARVRARVRDSSNAKEVVVEFRLRRRQFGSRKGAFMTCMVKKLDG